MKKGTIIRMAAAGTLAAMLIGGAAITASAANGIMPTKPVKPMPIRVIEAPPIGLRNQVPMLKQMQEKLREYCRENGVPYYMAVAVIEQISGFDNSYHGDNGQGERVGYFGVPLAATSMFEKLRGMDLTDPYDNMEAGCYLLGWLKSRHESWEETMLCYDVGEANAARYFLPWGEVTKLVKDTMAAARKWRLIVGS